MKPQQAALTEQYRATDEIAEDAVQEYLAGHPGDVRIRQVADGIKWDSGGRSAYRITTVLKQFGYIPVRRRVAGALGRYWTPPGTSLIDDPDPGENT